MFCHKCGSKLVSGALFCSRCGTRVPPEIVEEMEQTVSVPDKADFMPISKSESAPAPDRQKEPSEERGNGLNAEADSNHSPESVAKPEPDPEPELSSTATSDSGLKPLQKDETPAEKKEVSAAETIPAPEPESTPDTEKPKAEQAPEDASEPDHGEKLPAEKITEPETAIAAEPAAVPLPEEKVLIPITVTSEQVQREETIVLQEECLEEPMQLTLRKGMKDGMRLRLTNAKTKPAPSGAKQVAVVNLRIIQIQPKNAAPVSKPTGVPSSSEPVKRTDVPQPIERNISSQPPKSQKKKACFSPISANCNFQLCREGELKTGYHFGGTDQGGTIEIAPSSLTLYVKSVGVAVAFGAIGSALEGKGKLLASIRPEDIASYEKNTKNGRFQDYQIHLKDGRVLKVGFVSNKLETILFDMDQFLSQI